MTTTEYDAANRKIRVTAPAIPVAGENAYKAPVTEMKYDRVGNVLEVIDAKKRSTVNTYDVLNRLKTTKDAAGITVSYDYDAVGNRTKVTDGKGQITTFGYDGLKRNTTTTNHLGFTTTLKYDGVNKTKRTDADGQVDYTYDNRHRLSGVAYAGHAEQNRGYTYDDAGHLLTVTEPGKDEKADVAYEYDELYRVTKETSGEVTHLYGYDLAGNRTSTVYGGGGLTITSSYDALNRLTKLVETPTAAIPRETTYEYDLAGNVVGKGLPNGDTIVTSYDALNRSIQIVGQNDAGDSLYHYVQGRDIVGNVVAIAEEMPEGANHVPSKYSSLEYDGVDRLLKESVLSAGVPSETTYTYDTANNRATRKKVVGGVETNDIYVYDGGNRLTSATEQVGETTKTTSFEYNQAGSRTVRKVNGVVNATYGYDAEQRLVTLGQDGHDYAYTYDYRTRRVERNEDTVATKVVFSGGTSVQEKLAGSTTVEYVRGSDWGGGVGGILYTLRGGMPSFTHYDSRGDVTTKTSSDWDVTYQASYEAFGTRTREQGSTSDRQKANTKEEDPSGLLNEGMRYRDLETGTFITADPAGFVDGPNLYAYVRQNPWTAFDPEGLETRYGYGGYVVKGTDHHWSPVSTWEENRFSSDVQSALDKHTVGPDPGKPNDNHGWSRAHDTYNKVASEETSNYVSQWKKKGGGDPSGLSDAEAKKFSDGLVKQLQKNEYIKEFGAKVRAGRGGKESLNDMLDSFVRRGKIAERHQGHTTKVIAEAGKNSASIRGGGVVIAGGYILYGLIEAEASGANEQAVHEIRNNWRLYMMHRKARDEGGMMVSGATVVNQYGVLMGVPAYIQSLMIEALVPK